MKESINNNNKYWFAMLYTHVRKFMIGSMFTYQRFSKDFIFCYFIKIWVPVFVRPKEATNLKNTLHYPLMNKQGYKLRHTQTCHNQTQQLIYSCAKGYVMSLFL